MAQDGGSDAQAPGYSIANLASLVSALDPEARARVNRLIHIREAVGELVAPDSMSDWITKLFGSVEAVERQVIVKTTNLVTMEGTLFNALRASRPFESVHPDDLRAQILNVTGDPFCTPLQGTPEDIFGRVRGDYCITASNIAKYDAFHGVVIFDEHNPLTFSEASIIDALEVGLRWGHRALECDPEAKYCFFMWNCLWKSGASIIHGHAQVASTGGMHYARVESLRRQARAYRLEYGLDYFEDLVAAHRSLHLVTDLGDTAILSSLTPIKEKEVLLIGPGMTLDLMRSVSHVLDCFVHRMGVTSFNLAVYLPPLAPTPEEWNGFPHVVRIVDRGSPLNRTADFGAMELYASSVVSSDPFRVAEALAL